jgi:Tol biopolymer transport system component
MPSLSPDGSWIAFFQPDAGHYGDFWVIPSMGGDARRLTFDVAAGRSPTWTPDGRAVVFSSQRAGSMTLWKIAAVGGTPEPVLMGAGEDTDPEFSQDGSKLLYSHTRASFALTILNLSAKNTREIIEHKDRLLGPAFAPRGDRIAYFRRKMTARSISLLFNPMVAIRPGYGGERRTKRHASVVRGCCPCTITSRCQRNPSENSHRRN